MARIFAYVNKDGIWYKALLRKDKLNSSMPDLDQYLRASTNLVNRPDGQVGFIEAIPEEVRTQLYQAASAEGKGGYFKATLTHGSAVESDDNLAFDPQAKILMPDGYSLALNLKSVPLLEKTHLATLQDVRKKDQFYGMQQNFKDVQIVGKYFDLSKKEALENQLYGSPASKDLVLGASGKNWGTSVGRNVLGNYMSSWFGAWTDENQEVVNGSTVTNLRRAAAIDGYQTLYEFSQRLQKEAGTRGTYISREKSEFLNFALASLLWRDAVDDESLRLIQLNAIAATTPPLLAGQLQLSNFEQIQDNLPMQRLSTARYDAESGLTYLGGARASLPGIPGNDSWLADATHSFTVKGANVTLGGLASSADVNNQFGRTSEYEGLPVKGRIKQIGGGATVSTDDFLATLRGTVFAEDANGAGWLVGGEYVTESQYKFLLLTSGEATRTKLLEISKNPDVPAEFERHEIAELKYNIALYSKLKNDGEVFVKFESKNMNSENLGVTLVDRSHLTFEAGGAYLAVTDKGVVTVRLGLKNEIQNDEGILLQNKRVVTSSGSVFVDWDTFSAGFEAGKQFKDESDTKKDSWFVKMSLAYRW
ncbi:hypothetical protein FJZ26_03275 [Candidatus Parvarchaeota archaeon]|nr:hypothetical protein [Candidatus Parvarchaeota archaeon]